MNAIGVLTVVTSFLLMGGIAPVIVAALGRPMREGALYSGILFAVGGLLALLTRGSHLSNLLTGPPFNFLIGWLIGAGWGYLLERSGLQEWIRRQGIRWIGAILALLILGSCSFFTCLGMWVAGAY